MRHLNTYKTFESSGYYLTKDQVSFLNLGCGTWGEWKYNHETKLVDVEGKFSVPRTPEVLSLSVLPVNFGKVTDSFVMSNCPNLTSLKGSPKWVGGNFDCRSGKLESLEWAPDEVGGDFICSYNKLKSLEGAPKRVGKTFACHENQLTSLEGCPDEIMGDFYCSDNFLKDLVGGPKWVKDNYACGRNPLETLKGAPDYIGQTFIGPFNLEVGGGFWKNSGMIDAIAIQKDPRAKALLVTVMNKEELQKMIDSDPEKFVILLGPIHKEIKKMVPDLKFPEKYQDTMDDFSDLKGLGF
jgi:hypothetical protein